MRFVSPRSRSSRTGRSAAALILTLTIAACGDPPAPTQPTAADRATANRVASSVATSELREPEQHLHALAREIPGFGGYFIDSSGVVVGYVTDLARGGALRQRLEAFVRAGHMGSRTRPIAIRKDQFEFASLARWRDIVSGQLLGIVPGVVMSDADEAANRVTIGIDEATYPGVRAEVRRALQQLGVPANAVRFVASRPASLDVAKAPALPAASMMFLNQNLWDVPSPVVAGYKFFVPGGGYCTLGPVVTHNGNPAVVINSHCTSAMYAFDGSPIKATDFTVIGSEVVDPGPTCGSNCRRSDAALIDFATGVPYDVGRIARTTDVTWTWGAAGSRNVNQSNPTRDLIDEENAVVGMTVLKTGATTATTGGYVTNTCVDIVAADGYTRACSVISTYYAAGGDSGSPVYTDVPGTGAYRLVGIHWGSDSVAHHALASYFSWAKSEIGGTLIATRPSPPSVYITGPSDVSNSPACRLRYEAHATGGAGGYTYAWNTDGVILENYGDVVYANFPGTGDSRFIEVTVTDAAGGSASAYYEITASPYGDQICYI